MEAIIESVDEFYSENLAEEVKRGMREAASRGYWMGSLHSLWLQPKVHGARTVPRSAPPWNWTRTHDARWSRRIYDLALQAGTGMLKITVQTLNDEGVA